MLKIFRKQRGGTLSQQKQKLSAYIISPALARYFLKALTALLSITIFLFALLLAYRLFSIIFTLHNFLFVFKYLFVSFLALFALWLLFLTLQELLKENEKALPLVAFVIKSAEYKLMLFSRDVLISEVPLDKPYYSLGRGSRCEIVIDEESVSRQHCMIVSRNGRYHVVDDGSSNGTFVNGEKTGDVPRLLQSGDEITFGAAGKATQHRIVFQYIKTKER